MKRRRQPDEIAEPAPLPYDAPLFPAIPVSPSARGLHASEHELEAMLLQALAELPALRLPARPSGELSSSEVDALRAGGFTLEPIAPGERDVLAETAAAHAALLATSSTAREVAALLEVDESRIRHLLAARRLYGVKVGHEWRLPRFQLTGKGVVPGIGDVLRELPDDLHPVTLARWLETPQPELELEGRATSPRDWLLSGGPPRPVAALARDLGF